MNSVVRLAIILDLEVVAIRYSPRICFLWDRNRNSCGGRYLERPVGQYGIFRSIASAFVAAALYF